MAGRSAGRVFAAIAVGAGVLVGGTIEGAAADVGPTARVTPADGLVDQQLVKVRASGFPRPPAEPRIAIVQCAADAVDLAGCGDDTAINVTTDMGSAVARYRVSRILRTPAFGEVDCAATPDRCIVVVASLDGSQIVAVPVDFDPRVPPLPPVDIDATLAPEGTVNVRTGVATLEGTVTCSTPTPIVISGWLGQQRPSGDQFFARVDGTVHCDGTTRWAVRVRPPTDPPGSAFFPGPSLVDLVVLPDRLGPRERVFLDLDVPLVARN